MRIASSNGAGSLLSSAAQVKRKNRKSFRATKSQPTPGEKARLINLRMYLWSRFEEIMRSSDWWEAFGLIDDLENMVCHHPDLRPYAHALRRMLDGWQVMAGLGEDFR